MRDDRPSFTAAVVALARALYHHAPEAYGDSRDAIAALLLPRPLALLSRAAPALWGAPWLTRQAFRALTFGLSEHIALRTRAIDAALEQAVREGCSQLVTLGAGLDARPWRMDALAQTTVFEVDHPATQRYKRPRVEALTAKAAQLRFIPVNFERDSLTESLQTSGHDTAVKTAWIIEGVTLYLEREAVLKTLEAVSARSAPGSVLIMTYAPLEVFTRWAGGKTNIQAASAAIGERFKGIFESDDVAAMLAHEGFAIREDSGTREWAARYAPAVDARSVWLRERLVVGVKS